MWQREQGWDGVPRNAEINWGVPHDEGVTRLLLEPISSPTQSTGASPSQSQERRPQEHPPLGRQQAGQRAPGPGLELMRDAMSSLVGNALPKETTVGWQQGTQTSQQPSSQRAAPQGPVLQESKHEASPVMEVVRVQKEVLKQEPPLPLQILREISEQEALERQLSKEALTELWHHCNQCSRAHGRSQVVMGEGPLNSRVMLVSEGPSTQQDHEGSFWEGEQGTMLTSIVKAIGISPKDIYLTAVVHCFRSQPRVPQKEEIEACFPLLEQEISIVQPDFLITLGAVATQSLLRVTKRLSHLRGFWHKHHNNSLVFPTYSPAYLLKRPTYKGMAWDDWKKIREQLLESGCQTNS